MRCKHCGEDFRIGLTKCPACGANIHYWGKTQIIEGVERSTLSIKDILSGLWESHEVGAGDRMFIAGTPLTTPKPSEMLQEWEKPWLYARVLFIGIIFLLLSNLNFKMGYPAGFFAMSILGSLLVPLSIVVFYWELNIPRDIPMYKVLMIFFIGGMLSLIFTGFLPSVDRAYLAPLTEEPGKIIALALFLYMMDCKYIFSGLLLGAAVGAGFAAFEDIGYVINSGIESVPELLSKVNIKSRDDLITLLWIAMTKGSEDTFFLRSISTIGGHVTWAAVEGGALMWAKGRERLQLKHFFSPKFLIYVAATMALHFAWNFTAVYGITITRLPYVGGLNFLILMALAVMLAFTLINKAIAQILLVVNLVPPVKTDVTPNFILTAISGPMSGNKFELKMPLILGRDPSSCNVILPSNTAGVSRKHCKIERRGDDVYIMDIGSSSGTFLNGQRLEVNKWYKVNGNFYLGSPEIMFSVS